MSSGTNPGAPLPDVLLNDDIDARPEDGGALGRDPSLDDPGAFRQKKDSGQPGDRGTVGVAGNGDSTPVYLPPRSTPEVEIRTMGAIGQLSFPDDFARAQAVKELTEIGEGALPQLLANLKHPDAAVRKACEEAARKIVENSIKSFEAQGRDIAKNPGGVNHQAFQKLIDDADRLATDPTAKQARADYIMALAQYTKDVPGVIDAAKSSMRELLNPQSAGTNARIAYADALGNMPDAARTQLAVALQQNPLAAQDNNFLQAMKRHNAAGDPQLMALFTSVGGDQKALAGPGADAVPFVPVGEKSPTFEMWDKFGFPYYGENTYNMKPEDRLRKYDADKGTMKPEDRVQLLADHFLTATTEVERKQAMDRLRTESQNGNAVAQKAVERLPLLKLAIDQGTLKPWSADFVFADGQRVDLTDRNQRLSFIQEQMKTSPIDRDHHAVINALVKHYFYGETQNDRDFALESLRKEVQNGNLSGGIALRQLATADAALRLAQATSELDSPQLQPGQVQDAKDRQMKALKDLAAIDHAERRIGEQTPASGRALDYLTRSPIAGINPDDVKLAAESTRREANQREAQASDLFTKAVAGSGQEREQALAQLKEMAEAQFKNEKTDTFMKLYRAAALGVIATDATANLHDPAAVAKSLAKLGPLLDSDYAARDVSKKIAEMGPAGADLVKAIRSGNVADIEAALKKPGVSEAVKTALKGQVESVEKYQLLKPGDAITAFARPGQLEELRKQQAKEAKERQEKVDDLVAAYLHRDTTGSANRGALSAALPADGQPMTLKPDQAELKQQLIKGLEENAFTPAEAKLVQKLIKGETLGAQEVGALRKELAMTADERRANSVNELKELSKAHVHLGGEFEPTLKALESISNAEDVGRKTTEAMRVLQDTNSSPQARKAAIDALTESMRLMEKYGTDGYHHQLSTKYMRAFEDKVPGGLKGALEKLQSGTPAEQLDILGKLKKNLPDGSGEANEFRALRIVRDLGPESTATDFERARKQLEAEIAASKADSGKANERAEDWHKWTSSAENVTRLSLAAKEGNADAARKAVDALVEQARTGDPYARAAVAAFLAGNTDNRRIGAWMDKYPGINDKPLYVPNLNSMPEALRRELTGKVVDFYAAEGDKLKLNQMESTSLAYALAKAEQGGDKDNRDKLASLLDKAVQGPERSAVLSGIFDALKSEIPGSKALGQAYLKGIDDPVFAKQFNGLAELAQNGNEGAVIVLAAVAAGRTDGHAEANPKIDRAGQKVEANPIALRAQNVLDKVGAAADNKDKVVEAMLYIDGLAKGDARFADNHRMLASMGKLAAELSPQSGAARIEEVRNALRARFEEGGKKTDTASSKSALEGMMQLAKHWKKEDVEALVKNLNSQVVDMFRRDADKIPAEARNRILEASQKLLTDKDVPLQDRLNAINTMSAFAKHLSKAQVELLASFGGDEKVNRGGSNGEKKLQDLGVTSAEDRKLLKSAVAESLMNVMFKAKNERPPAEGPREAAFGAFRDLPWPIKTGEKDGKPVFVESRDSKQLTEALISYAKGRPFDVRLAEQINLVVDNAKLPRPAGAVMMRMGLGDPKNPYDQGFLDRADKIVERYDNFNGMSGDEVVRRVAANIELANSLPGGERAKLMGWTELKSDDEKRLLGWVPEPPDAMKADMGWDRMTEKQKEDFRWQNVKLSPSQVFGEMLGGALQNPESYNSKLLGDLGAQADALRRGRAQEEARAKGEADGERAAKKANMDELEALTKKGVSFGSKVWNTITFNNARDDDFNAKQSELARNISGFNERISAADAREAEAKQAKDALALSMQVGEYHRLLNAGEQTAADKMAIKMWSDHGPALKMLAPSVWNDLTVPRDSTLQGQSLLQRLQTRGLAQWDSVPSYVSGEAGFRQALGLQPADGVTDARGLMQLKPGEGRLDTTAMRNHMLGRLNEDPALKRVSALAREMNEDLGDLSKMFSAAMHGTKYETFIDIAKQKATHLKEVFDKVSREDLFQMTRRIKSMEDALAEMKKPGAKPDPETVQQLEKMIDTYKGMHNMLNKFDPNPKYPEVIKPDEKTGEKHNPNKQIMDMVKTVTEGGMTASTFTNWVQENALTIGLTIAACAATVAACATLGVGSPVAVGLWVAVAGLAAREISSEIMYHVNKDGYTGWGQYGDKGAKVADWYRKMDRGEFTSLEQAMERFGKDVAYPYAKDILRDWAAFVVTAGLSNYFFGGSSGVGETLKALVKSPPPNMAQLAFQAERAALTAQGSGQAASFMKQFLSNFGPELLNNLKYTGYQMALEGGVHEGIRQIDPEALHKMGEWGQFGLSFALSTAMAMGQGYKHGKQLLQEAKMGPNNTMEFKLSPKVTEADFANHMRQRGFEVKQTGIGKWEVLPFNAKPGTPPIKLENAARGEGKPPAEVDPPGGVKEKMKPANPDADILGPTAKQAIEELHRFGEKLTGKDYDGAMQIAGDLSKFPKTEVVEREFAGPTAKEFSRADAAGQQAHLESMLSKMSTRGKFEPPQTEPGAQGQPPKEHPAKIEVPKPTMDFEVPIGGGKTETVKIDLTTGKPISDKHTATPKAIDAAYQAFNAKHPEFIARLKAERALVMMEEKIHLMQHENGDKSISPRFHEFVADMAFDSPQHTKAVDDKHSPVTREQEVILALHDAGWPLSQIEHHFGNHHTETRAPVFEYLRAKEAIAKIPEPANRDFVNKLLENTPPASRRQMMQHMQEFLEKHGTTGGDFKGKVENFKQTAELLESLGGGRVSFDQMGKLYETVKNANEALAKVPNEDLSREYIEATIKEANPQLRKLLLEQLPELVRNSTGQPEELASSVEKMRDNLQRVADAMTADYRVLDGAIKELLAKHPELAKSEPFGKMLDETLANGFLRDPRLLEASNSNLLVKMAKDIQATGIPVDGKVKASLEKRINDLLNSNPEMPAARRQALEALATSFKLSDKVAQRIKDYQPSSAKGTEIVGADILDTFKQNHARSAPSINEFIEKLGKHQFNNSHDVKNIFPQTDQLGNGLFVFDIAGNNYRLVARVDFVTKQIVVEKIGTHAEYDRWKF